MIKNYKPSEMKTEITYSINFDRNAHGGATFPCDENGKILDNIDNPYAYENYKYCMDHPEEFVVYNQVRKRTHRYRVPATGTCHCGREIELFNQYCGACECECGQWYNLFGEEILPPSEWQEDIDYDY